MKSNWIISLITVAVLPATVFGQSEDRSEGFEIGPFVSRPGVEGRVAYDDRIATNSFGRVDDYYSELGVVVRLNNSDARYGVSASGEYGERFYSDFSNLNDNFYNARASLSSTQNPLQWGLSSGVSKSLSYNTAADASTGEGPEGILTDETSRIYTGNGNVSYEKRLSDRSVLTPSVGAAHYFQDFETDTNIVWQTYSVGCELAFAYSPETFITLSGDHSVQVNDDEDGTVSTVSIGTRSRATDKINWDGEVGVAFANYEESGSDQGLTGRLRMTWQVTEKVASYAFGGLEYQAGYRGSGARRIYRAGYGVNWQVNSRWMVSGQGLHNQDDELGAAAPTRYEGVEHFFSVSTEHAITEKSSVSGAINFANDEFVPNQTVYSLGANLFF
jgi:hypothetical protein